MKKNEIPPTRAREGLGLPSPRDFPRAEGSLVLEVYTRYSIECNNNDNGTVVQGVGREEHHYGGGQG